MSSPSCLLRTGFLLGLLFNPEDGRDMFLRKYGSRRYIPEDNSVFHSFLKHAHPIAQTV
jgi:hypothetical protein